MGGFVSSLFEKIGMGAEKLGSDTTSSLEGTKTGQKALSIWGNKENELNLTPQGKAIGSMISEYHRIKNVTLDGYNKNIAAVKAWHQGSDTARNTLPLNTATIEDLHQHAVQTNHPIQQVTNSILKQSVNPQTGISDTADLTLKELSLQNKSKARLVGLEGSVGAKMENVSPLLANMLEHPDPRVQLNGRAVADILSNELRDTQLMKVGADESLKSKSKIDVNSTFRTVNKFRQKGDKNAAQIPMLRTDPTYYTPEKAETVADDILRTVQIPFVAIPHIGQYFHLTAAAPLEAQGRALLGMDKKSMQHTIEASGILANTQWDVIHSDLEARTGKISQWTNSPTAASIIRKTIHTPGFNWSRLKQLSIAGSVGYHSAIFWADNALKGDKRSLAELIEMGIDPSDVIKQKGKLTEEQLQKGVYHFVNNRFFFERSQDRALYSNRNFFMRSATMYHGFISSETAFIRRELLKQFKAGDVKGIAQFVGTLGILFPAVAPMLKSLEVLARTGSTSQAGKGIQQDYKKLSGQSGFGDFTTTYFEMVAHIGAMGTAMNYYSAIKGNRLGNAVMGPMIGMGVQDGSDIINAVRGKSAKPLGRDASELIPVIGKPLAHTLFPTRAEESTSTGRIPHAHSHFKKRGY